MASESSSADNAAEPGGGSSAWLYAKQLWAGISIITMWLAVLFVGIFGGDFISSSSTNGFTKIPVVVFLLPFVLPATIVVARRAFASGPDAAHAAPDEGTQARAERAPEPPALRAKHA